DSIVSISGKPGCLFVGLDPQQQQDVPPDFAALMSLRAGLVINAGDDADEVAANVQSLLSAALGSPVESLDHTLLPLPIPAMLHRHDDYLIFAVGPDVLDGIVDRLAAQSGGMSEHQGFAAGWQDLGMDRTGMITFLDIERGVEKIGSLTGTQAAILQGMRMAGMDGATWAMGVSGIENGSLISRGHLRGVTGDDGLMALASGRGITADDFKLVPDDCDLVFAFSADTAKIYEALMKFVSVMDQRASAQIQAGYDNFARNLGIDIQQDLFAALDHVITLSNSPGDAGWIASSPVLTIGMKDQRGVQKTSDKIVEAFQRAYEAPAPGEFHRRAIKIERRTFLETEIFMINVIGEDDLVVAPSWCLTDTHLMVALHPQALKSRLRRLAADDWKSYGQKFQGGPEGDVIAHSSLDVPRLLPQFYGMLPWIGQVVFSEMQSEGFDMNLLDLPSAAAIMPYTGVSRSYLVRTPNGMSQYAEGLPVLSKSFGLMPMLFIAGARVQMAPIPMEVEEFQVEVEAEAAEAADVLIE
ncbi:MAG: hypothetical protein MI861_18275, partial [Pirellulales bacterium]|nr:hypothetical protein [Pirellulales bacterium]